MSDVKSLRKPYCNAMYPVCSGIGSSWSACEQVAKGTNLTERLQQERQEDFESLPSGNNSDPDSIGMLNVLEVHKRCRTSGYLAVVANKGPVALWIQGSKLLETCQFPLKELDVQLRVERCRVVPWRPMIHMRHVTISEVQGAIKSLVDGISKSQGRIFACI